MSLDATMGTHKLKRSLLQICTGVAAGLCLSLLAVSEAIAANFSFTRIADTRSEFTSILNGVAINDSGTVAFIALSGTKQGVYTSSGVQITEINSLPPFLNTLPRSFFGTFLISNVAINNNDTVAFIGRLNSVIGITSSVFVSQGGSVITRGSESGTSRFGGDSILNFALNNQDELVYFTETNSFPGVSGSRLTLSRPNQTNVNIARALSGVPSGNPPAAQISLYRINSFDINNFGEVIFDATRRRENSPFLSPGTSAIFTYSGDSFNTLVETNASAFALDINDNGDVVLSNGNTIGLFNRSNNVLTTIADTSGIFSRLGSPAINNNGNIAFVASLDIGGTGIFTGTDSITDKVIATGDTLFGSTVTNLNFIPQGFNNNSQIAFLAQFSDGTQGIFRADLISESPKSVPEGTSVLGLVLVALFFNRHLVKIM